MENTATIEGVVKKIVFVNEQNNFTVAVLQLEKGDLEVTIVGSLGALTVGECLKCTGEWVRDNRFGTQFRVSQYESLIPSTEEGLLRFLSSGMISGIGKVYARRLIQKFGMDLVRVIEQEPKKLSQVEGFGKKRIRMLLEGWEKHRQIRDVMIFLHGLGITSTMGLKIYQRYENKSIQVIKDNPYKLASEIRGIGFERADQIARNLGFDLNSAERAQAGIAYVLEQAASADGHCYLPETILIDKSVDLLSIEEAVIKKSLERLLAIEVLVAVDLEWEDQRVIYLKSLYRPERQVSEKLAVINAAASLLPPLKVDRAIAWVEKETKIALDPKQVEALAAALTEKVVVITGGPGTGKTTLINCLLRILKYKKVSVTLAAPTGRAAKRLSEITGEQAATVHRLLEFSPMSGTFLRNEAVPLETDVVVLDEVSMVDIVLMDSLLRAMPASCTLILVGDVDQLPSVGPGNVLRDIIDSGIIKTVYLDHIFRQSDRSRISINAHYINRGQMPVMERGVEETLSDFYFVKEEQSVRILDKIKILVSERIPQRFGFDPKMDVQVLSPMHKGLLGIENLNHELQQLLNPGGRKIIFGSRNFRIGDKVMQVRNNYSKDIYNGDIGTVIGVDEEERKLIVDIEGNPVSYTPADIDELVLAYAISIHKSQGSEYKAVVIPLNTEHFVMLQRNLLYTGITRGKKLVVLLGSEKAVRIAINNNRISRRYTNLKTILRQDAALFEKS